MVSPDPGHMPDAHGPATGETVMDVAQDTRERVPISVIIPAYDREGSIARAIASVQRPVDAAYEVIVVDDGSADRTADRAQGAIDHAHEGAGRVLRQANGGPGKARNTGAKAARGRYLAFLDSDDFWFPHTLSACLGVLDEDPALIFLQTVDVTEGAPMQVQNGGDPIVRRFDGFLEAVIGYPMTRYGSCNVVIRRDVYEALGGFTDDVRCSEDTDLFLRAAASGPCFVLSGPPLVGHVAGSQDRLTGRFSSVLAGYEFMLARDAGNHYPTRPDAARLKDKVLAQCTAHTVLAAFAAGHVGTAYGLYLRGLPRLARASNWHWLIRLPLVPLLAVLRPSSYAMRWSATGR